MEQRAEESGTSYDKDKLIRDCWVVTSLMEYSITCNARSLLQRNEEMLL